MILNAISIGYAIPRVNFDAVVHSVFRSAVNLRINENRLLAIVASSEADLPQGIRVDTPGNFSFEIFRAGEQATLRNAALRLDSLTIELHGARRWKCDLPALEADTTTPATSAAWSYVWDALNRRQKLTQAEIVGENLFHKQKQSIVAEKVGKAMRELVETTRRYDSTLTEESVRALIGLGPGLTPTGDDLLVGYVAGLWCAVRSRSERAQFVKNLGEAIIRHSMSTNDISRAYLYHAAQGQVSSLLANLAEAICAGEDPDRLLDAAENAMRVGHTSGMDGVTGLLVGLAAWDGGRLCLVELAEVP